jgi:hypothetical protein
MSHCKLQQNWSKGCSCVRAQSHIFLDQPSAQFSSLEPVNCLPLFYSLDQHATQRVPQKKWISQPMVIYLEPKSSYSKTTDQWKLSNCKLQQSWSKGCICVRAQLHLFLDQPSAQFRSLEPLNCLLLFYSLDLACYTTSFPTKWYS